ncbi:MAG TPA: carbohydrate ABC transporter permease [Candidatus Mediterraneibacter excrementigallinarum]|nr:carbohydrate ABC transporter permease [Candidatus Mediterraneibacter excrementigallinarum]
MLMVFPLFVLVTDSFMGSREILERFGPVLAGTEGRAEFVLFPQYPTLRAYVQLLLDSPEFFTAFWNSVFQTGMILAGQLVVAVPGAWAFARYRFPGRRALWFLYMLLMILPFQVTMVSGYLVLSAVHLMDTHWAVILPGVFSTLPVFILKKTFSAIPREILEAAEVDGAGELRIFLLIGIPLGRSGIFSIMILGFLEYWNAIEQPMTFLRTESLMPLSLYLPDISTSDAAVSFAASIVMLLPALLLFFFGQEYLEQGIAASGIKE